ncbi:MAG: hypothetical protein PHO12_04700 [Bacteroidales bacterium]|nr:hypothetical protein [Bacteroidales bacterium]MDD4683943.1 hypothetical protein [Bacteroidales bacterium]
METLLKKDRIQEVNPYLFQKIQTKINNQHSISFVPSWGLNALRLSIITLALLMGFNIYSTYSSSSDVSPIAETNSYKQFVEDYHFEALSSLYPVELLSEE